MATLKIRTSGERRSRPEPLGKHLFMTDIAVRSAMCVFKFIVALLNMSKILKYELLN